MRKLAMAGLAVAFLGAASVALAEGGSGAIRFGGGFLYNNKAIDKTAPGGHVAIDIGIPGKPVAISPLVDFYKKSGQTTVLGGVNLIVKPKMSSDKASVYLGVGGGIAHSKISILGVSASVNKAMIDVVFGVDIKASEKASIFIEPRYVWGASSTINGVAAHVGLAIHLMK